MNTRLTEHGAPRVTIGKPPTLFEADPRIRFGLVALATDLTFEADLAAMLPPQARLHVTRVAFANPTTPANLMAMGPRLADAAATIVPGVPLAALCFGCTSGSAVLGNDAICTAFAAARPEARVVTPTLGLLDAAAALDIRRVAIMTPYLPETMEPLVAYLGECGLEIPAAHCLGLADDRDMARIPAADIVAGALAADHPDAEAVFLSCTSLPALPVLDEIERRLGKPALCSNQVCAWSMLRAAGLEPARRFGHLMARADAAA